MRSSPTEVGWSQLSLVMFFVGFGVACFGVAGLAGGDVSARTIGLTVIGGLLFVGCGLAIVPLYKLDRKRASRRRKAIHTARTPLAPGARFDSGHVWHFNMTRVLVFSISWLMAVAAFDGEAGVWIRFGTVAFAGGATYMAWTWTFASARTLEADGIVLRTVVGDRLQRFDHIQSWSWVANQRAVPPYLFIRSRDLHFGKRWVIPIYDDRLLALMQDEVRGHT